ncbi:ferredoxin-type protein NapF [Spongorhabdus nitratireducens]
MADENIDHSRRSFLSLKRNKATPLRPPWFGNENRFTSICTRCGDCITECPESILFNGSGGFPEVNFDKGECTFCQNCAGACSVNALHFVSGTSPWQLKAIIGQNCIATQGVQCLACVDECPTEAIHLAPETDGTFIPRIQDDNCTGCGACYRVCPVTAIKMQEPVLSGDELPGD